MIDDDLYIHDPRRAGLVKRYHSQAHQSTQTVAEHTWQLLRIITTIWPEAPRSVLMHVIYHDIPEGCTGDLPYTTKLASTEIKRHMDALEDSAMCAMRRLWNVPRINVLTVDEKQFVKACELVEFIEYFWNEKNMGNRYIESLLRRIMLKVSEVRLNDTYLNTRFHEYVKTREHYEDSVK